jgi:hypothetical protein
MYRKKSVWGRRSIVEYGDWTRTWAGYLVIEVSFRDSSRLANSALEKISARNKTPEKEKMVVGRHKP